LYEQLAALAGRRCWRNRPGSLEACNASWFASVKYSFDTDVSNKCSEANMKQQALRHLRDADSIILQSALADFETHFRFHSLLVPVQSVIPNENRGTHGYSRRMTTPRVLELLSKWMSSEIGWLFRFGYGQRH